MGLVTLLIYKVLKLLAYNEVNTLKFSYFTDLQGSQTTEEHTGLADVFSYFTDLQGSQTHLILINIQAKFSYFTDLQGSQTPLLS